MSYLPPRWPIPADLKVIEVNQYPLSYREQGSGVPLVLVHGSICDYRIWTSQVEILARQHRVLAPSLRHYFPEIWDRSGSDFSFAQHTDDLIGFIEALRLGRVHLLGHSRGGAVAIEVAKRRPNLIRTLILEDTAARLELPDNEESRKAAAFREKLFGDLREHYAAGKGEQGIAIFIDRLIGPGTWETLPPEIRDQALQNITTAIVDDPLPLTTDEDLQKFRFPVLMMNGERSPPVYHLIAREMQRRGGLEQAVTITDAGHAMHIENPTDFTAQVLAFTAAH